MRKNLSIKIFFLLICLCAFASAAVAQEEKPQAIIFYEFDLKEIENSKLLTEKLNEFINRLSKEPETTKGFISIAGNSKLAEKIKSFLAENTNLTSRIMFNWNLKYPNQPSSFFDFYLIPQGAEIPYVNVHEPVVCPTLSIDAPKKVTRQNSVATFTAKVKGGEDKEKIKYVWKISAGKILEVQETPTIKVNVKEAKEIIATVEISGMDDECQREASFTTKIQ